MNLRELASFIGIDQRQAEKLAQRNQIPCQKVGGQLRFNRAEITDWLQQQMGTMAQKGLADMDAGITAHRQTDPEDALITPMLRLQAISISLPARTKNSALRELVALAHETELLYDGEALLEALIKREELCSTAMEAGIAIPHPRRPLPHAIADSLLVIAHTSQGIGFGGPDGGLTDLFFMTCSQDDRHHLHVLARLCRMLHDSSLADDLRHAANSVEIIQLMRDREEQVIAE
jgi:PTS system nitrogen regulatory IIA component